MIGRIQLRSTLAIRLGTPVEHPQIIVAAAAVGVGLALLLDFIAPA